MFAPYAEIEDAIGPVQEIPAPSTLIGGIHSAIGDAVASLGPDDVAALMALATSDGGAKVAFVAKSESGWSAVAWFQRADGQNSGGIGVLKTWKR